VILEITEKECVIERASATRNRKFDCATLIAISATAEFLHGGAVNCVNNGQMSHGHLMWAGHMQITESLEGGSETVPFTR